MRHRRLNRLVQLVMAAALIITGLPLLRPWLPTAPLAANPMLPEDYGPVPGKIVVDAKDGLTPADLQDLNRRYGLSLSFNSAHSVPEKLLVADVTPGQEQAFLDRLRKDPRIEAAEPMNRFRTYFTPNDERFKDQWHLKMIGAEKAWDRSRGKGVVVAVIDTGVAFESDDKCYRARDFSGTKFTKGYDFVNDDKHPNDDHGHGTHVAGTIAETTDNKDGAAGLAFEASIMPLKVLDAFGTGTNADIADAVRYAADNGAKVINMSLGGPMPDLVLRGACQYAVKKGVLIICAAGNSRGGKVGYPAAFPECLAVSAVGPSGELAFYSSVGKQVAIAGPGGDMSRDEKDGVLQNTVRIDHGTGKKDDDYFYFQGTSMASPHVAGAAALVMARGVKDPAEVRQILIKGATPKKPADKYGAGILSASKSVELTDHHRRDSLLKLVFTVIAGVTGVGVGAVRSAAAGLLRIPFAPFGLVLGLLGPDLVFGWLGYGSPFNIILHSALIPLYLLWEAESRPVYRFVAAAAVGMAVHLAWDAAVGHTPFGGVVPDHALPWLWVNAVVGLGVALVAWRRSCVQP
jgi:serine protease